MIATTRCKGGREQVREYLIEARKKAGLTQQDVANRIGISRQYYQMVETGERQKRMDLSMPAFWRRPMGKSTRPCASSFWPGKEKALMRRT